MIMNPPFTRKQFINQQFRNALSDRFGDYKSFLSNELSYWSYFVFLADRFLDDGGRLALVLPASVLRQPSNIAIRKLISKNYTLRYVITSEYRAAFSESASFREVLLLAEKSRKKKGAAMFCSLNVLPNSQNVEDLTNALRSCSKTETSDHLDPFGSARFISQEELEDVEDWFRFIPGEEQRLPELMNAQNLSQLSEVVPKIIQGLRLNRMELGMRPENTMLSYVREERTIIDWKITREDESNVWAIGKESAVELKFPKKCLALSTRTATGMDKLLMDRPFDYIVVDRFKGDDDFWNGAPADDILVARLKQIRARSAYLIVSGRNGLNLAAPGTRLLAFCSKYPIAPTWAFWSLKTRTFEEACILSLWWNSTFMLNQLIDARSEIEGSRVWFAKDAVTSLRVLDHTKLSTEQKKVLESCFASVSSLTFPSLLDQLKNGFQARTEIDQTIAKIAKIPVYNTISSLRELQIETGRKLESLRSMMGRK